jgi:hypothetical protein
MKLSDRVDKMEKVLEQHLIESGEIRSDLKWIKKSFWCLVGIAGAVAGVGVEKLWR